MNKILLICVLGCLSFFSQAETDEMKGGFSLPLSDKDRSETVADSVMKKVIGKAAEYENMAFEYEAEVYVKGTSDVLKRNFLFRFAPKVIPVDRKNRNNIFELVTNLKYRSPNNFVHNFEAVNGNIIPDNRRQAEIMNFLNVNIYSSTAYDEEILLPLAKNAFKMYYFSLDTIWMDAGYKVYKIRYEPKQWSQKLIGGYLYILDELWSVDKMEANGHMGFAEFSFNMEFGRDINYFFLPRKMDLYLRYKVAGNIVETNYLCSFQYKNILWKDIDWNVKKSLDLTQHFGIVNDSIPIVKDTAFWNLKRPEPLTPEEKLLYNQHTNKSEERLDTMKYIEIGQKIVNTMNFNYKSTRIKYSGILNPFKFGYSGSDGITYKQQFRLSRTFANDKMIRFAPEVGFVFKRKEVFFKVGGDWIFIPKRLGGISLWVGNGNQGYSSEVTERINELLKDSAFKFEDLNVKYYKDYNVNLKGRMELFNGFLLGLGISYHYRKPVQTLHNDSIDNEIVGLINGNYGDFTPVLNITYTPRQYYRMDGNRKEYVRSSFPTFSFEYARGIPHVLGSQGEYERMELDIQQTVPLGLLRYLSYRIGGGFFSNQKSVYFADFTYFSRRNFPDSWSDHVGGVFQLLERNWYNASSSYAQAHLMYESPFILMPLLEKKIAAKYVFSERFYFSQLYMPILPSYTELGYGIGNHLFNLGFFVGFKKCKYDSFGVKFAFELFQ